MFAKKNGKERVPKKWMPFFQEKKKVPEKLERVRKWTG